jgi:hypothetical protein
MVRSNGYAPWDRLSAFTSIAAQRLNLDPIAR